MCSSVPRRLRLQRGRKELALGLRRQQHPGRVWDTASGVHALEQAVWEHRVFSEGTAVWHQSRLFHIQHPQRPFNCPKSLTNGSVFEGIKIVFIDLLTLLLFCVRLWTSGKCWDTWINLMACTPTIWTPTVVNGGNVRLLSYCMRHYVHFVPHSLLQDSCATLPHLSFRFSLRQWRWYIR